MKKIVTFIIFIIFFQFNLAEASAIFSVKSNNIGIKKGETISLPIYFNEVGEPIYSVKLSLKYSPEYLSVKSWAFADDWIFLKKKDLI